VRVCSSEGKWIVEGIRSLYHDQQIDRQFQGDRAEDPGAGDGILFVDRKSDTEDPKGILTAKKRSSGGLSPDGRRSAQKGGGKQTKSESGEGV
jgi:hypothetical protein